MTKKEKDPLKNKIRLANFNTKKDETSFVANIIEDNTIKSYEIEKPTDKIGEKFYIKYNADKHPLMEKVIHDNIEFYLQKCFSEEIEGSQFILNLKELKDKKVNIGYFAGMDNLNVKEKGFVRRIPVQFYFYELKQ